MLSYMLILESAVKDVGLRPLACKEVRVRIPLGHVCVSGECCVFSDRSLCVGLITRPEESYRVWCV